MTETGEPLIIKPLGHNVFQLRFPWHVAHPPGCYAIRSRQSGSSNWYDHCSVTARETVWRMPWGTSWEICVTGYDTTSRAFRSDTIMAITQPDYASITRDVVECQDV